MCYCNGLQRGLMFSTTRHLQHCASSLVFCHAPVASRVIGTSAVPDLAASSQEAAGHTQAVPRTGQHYLGKVQSWSTLRFAPCSTAWHAPHSLCRVLLYCSQANPGISQSLVNEFKELQMRASLLLEGGSWSRDSQSRRFSTRIPNTTNFIFYQGGCINFDLLQFFCFVLDK